MSAPAPSFPPAPADAGEPIPGKGSAAARRDYLQTLRSWLSKHQRYPRRARLRGLEGDAVVRLRFDGDATLASANVAEATGHRSLDEALAAMLRRAQPLPAPPDDADVAGRTIDVPVRFSLRDAGGDF
jgi:protein TonB